MDWGMTLSQNNSWHRYLRRVFASHLRPAVVSRYENQQQRAAVLLLFDMMKKPKGFMNDVRL